MVHLPSRLPFLLGFLFLFGQLTTGCGPGPGGDDGGVQPEDSGAPEDAGTDEDAGTEQDGGDPEPDPEPEPVPPTGVFGWNEIDNPEEVMVRRWSPLVADVGDGHAVLFGGADLDNFGGSPLDDVVWFDGRGAEPHFTSIEIAPPLNPFDEHKPAARYCGCAAYDPSRDQVAVVGGRSLQSFFTDTWILDLDSAAFETLPALAETPRGGLGCSLTYRVEDDAYYLFGGAGMTGSFNELWRLDGATRTWEQITVEGPAPGNRYDAWLGTHDGGLLMVGGARNAQQDFHADVWTFDLTSRTWTEVVGDDQGPLGRRIPWVRKAHDGSGLYMGFGNHDTDLLNDLWWLDLGTGAWTEQTLENGPTARGWSPPLPGGDGVIGWLMGGFDLDEPVADLWRLDADANDEGF